MCSTDRIETNNFNIENSQILIRKCDLTSSNYGNYANRLQNRKTLFQILLPFYSVVGIVNGIFPKYFTNIGTEKITILNFWGIFISITFLVISMQIALARYPERISEATDRLNKLKILKGEIQKSNNDNNEINDIWDRYNKIVSNGIIIHRRFFYLTCRETDRAKKIKQKLGLFNSVPDSEVRKHFSIVEQIGIVSTNILEFFSFVFIFLLPIIVYCVVLFLI